MKHEIELKFRINNLPAFEQKAAKLGIVFGAKNRQTDRIYLLENTGFDDLEKGNLVLRIRESAGKITSTAKRYVDGVSNRLESSIDVNDTTSVIEYLSVLGYVEVVCVDKKRAEANYLEAVITMDEVDGLGSFVEIEIVSDEEFVEQAKKRVLNIAKKLDLPNKDLVDQPYDAMLYQGEKK